ncbi:MAG: M23 family metallopeptidase [Treponema sp.]|jgi:murein DD-endopeptidase MepM/ murein hydrolase activator NlpD|nr:M23 family metallopeptidase [Treponema sp.]
MGTSTLNKYFIFAKGFLKNKAFWRVALIVSLLYYIPQTGFHLPITETAAAQTSIITYSASANGMGGGIFLDSLSAETYIELTEIEGQVEYLRPRMLTFSFHTMQSGDIIGHIAARAGLNEDTLLSVNNVRNSRLMQIGQVVKIPNQDGINYTVRAGDTLESIAAAHNTTVYHIRAANELFSDELTPASNIFVPGGRMSWVNRQEINGDLFIWPTTGRITSPFGFRRSPFTGVRQFHGGIDIAAPRGTPVRAAMAGRITRVGYNNILGNYIIINHHSNFRTVYAHLHVVRVRTGDSVATGERIGDVGSTGLSTGPHLHFEVHRNGVRVNPRTLMR